MDDSDEPSRADIERAAAALYPFVQAWKLSINPEDIDEMAYAVLRHARNDRSFEEIDAAVRRQLADWTFGAGVFQRTAYGEMSIEQATVFGVIELLVAGSFEAIDQLSESRATGEALRGVVADYGRTLVAPGDGWWATVEVTPIENSTPPTVHIAAPLWTAEEGRSDLTLELHLTQPQGGPATVDVRGLHVL